MLRILESQAPAKQSASSTITTLSGRLANATLLEDRRAAVLGLRSFAKIYPASVASGSLRHLIGCLSKDVEDVDTAKIILETLLTLFSPEESSPEASDDIALWLADEFTQRQENITALLDLLAGHDFFCRLYSLQLLSAISAARPSRTQECVYTAPLGVSRLVSILDDKREAIRNEGLLLLSDLSSNSRDLQKLVAFENAFDRVLSVIDEEGALTHGGAIIQDCLALLANLLRLNGSNQSYFRETGHIKKFAILLNAATAEQDSSEGVAEWARLQRDKNLWGLLAVIRMFLVPGSPGTQANQQSCWNSDVLTQILEIAFRPDFAVHVRAEALTTAADLIRSNRALQEAFGQQQVHDPRQKKSPQVNGHTPDEQSLASQNIISGLLDLALAPASIHVFDVRLAACECLKAYFYEHVQIKQFFLRRAIDGHMAQRKENDNILDILLDNDGQDQESDPYRSWIASVILLHLLFGDGDTKALAMSISSGDADKGEEVVTCIQILTANLILREGRDKDERILVGYLMVLCAWLYEDSDAVNDFLGEGSNVQAIIRMSLNSGPTMKPLVCGLAAFLLGIVYEFSTKDSPVTRETLHTVLLGSLGREQFVERVTKLRENPVVRDFEVLRQGSNSDNPGSLPEVFLDRVFVDFLKDNFSRILRTLDRPPGLEISFVANGVQKGISREMVDSLRAQVEAMTAANQGLESNILTLERKLGQEQADHRKVKDSSALELGRIKHINKALQETHDMEIQKLRRDEEGRLKAMEKDRTTALSSLEATMQQRSEQSVQRQAEVDAQHKLDIAKLQEEKQTIERQSHDKLMKAQQQMKLQSQELLEQHGAEVSTLKSDMERLQKDRTASEKILRETQASQLRELQQQIQDLQLQIDKSNKEHAQALQQAHEDSKSGQASIQSELNRVVKDKQALEVKAQELTEALEKAQAQSDLAESKRQTAQTELDDMLMVLSDLEEKRQRDKARLKDLGQMTSDDEDEDENLAENDDEVGDLPDEADTKEKDGS